MKKILSSFFLIFVVALTGFFFLRSEKKSLPKTQPYPFSTWTEFKDYKRLNMLLKGLAVDSLIDIPAYDLQELIYHHLNIKTYIGIRATKEEAQGLQAQFGSPLRSFAGAKIPQDPLPKADMILCWDCLSALSQQEVEAALIQFRKSGAKYLLMRHFPNSEKNYGNPEESFHLINWKLSPYQFPEPMIQIEQINGTVLALWSLDSIR